MPLSRNKLYSILIIACMAGYIWLFFVYIAEQSMNKPIEVCFVKHFINIPCPSCGSTRSILSLIRGDFNEALGLNPMGFLIIFIMLVAPLWIIKDLNTNRNTLYNFYQKTEAHLKRPQFAIPLVLIVIVNWIWNITQGL
jgi:hypothetical protein